MYNRYVNGIEEKYRSYGYVLSSAAGQRTYQGDMSFIKSEYAQVKRNAKSYRREVSAMVIKSNYKETMLLYRKKHSVYQIIRSVDYINPIKICGIVPLSITLSSSSFVPFSLRKAVDITENYNFIVRW